MSLAALVVTGVGNRILYKMALVPLGNHVFFLAQFQTFAYVAIYFSILGARYKCGFDHSDESMPKTRAEVSTGYRYHIVTTYMMFLE